MPETSDRIKDACGIPGAGLSAKAGRCICKPAIKTNCKISDWINCAWAMWSRWRIMTVAGITAICAGQSALV